jgi:hypothetical protein
MRQRAGFSLMGLALGVAGLSALGSLYYLFNILFFQGMLPQGGFRQLGIPHFEMIRESIVVWASLLGVFLLWGRKPDRNWQVRSGLLLMMCLVDAVLWGFDHAVDLGLYDAEVGHKWFRDSLGTAIGWSEFALIASLAADVAAHLGEPGSLDYARSSRSLATTGAMVWFMFFYFQTSWRLPFWPLRMRPPNPGTAMLLLGYIVLATICFVQTTILSLVAGRCCARALRQMAAEDHAKEQIPSRSEAGWDELNRRDPG